ncbi:unnamed protein product [Chondrus crispus]|uniref:Uncharacterized protein n=1 Tax=Chondrus crispus TaxID=2769 RepID=R7QNF2_CHOCR|nr:unnamed protein product [Chondrus crispus]CDF40017.1 unnamed protein product [Chondrus crispus]|eukprot:XP_005710311.1 unnamed protein product [Chondrus crispus]
MNKATVTGCGHVFCWKCICNWCSSNVRLFCALMAKRKRRKKLLTVFAFVIL